MLTLSTFRPRQDLLGAYTDDFGAALRRSKSLVALKAAKVEADLALKARGAFLASMNHELRTPLNAITGFAGLLRATDPTELDVDRRNEYLDFILQSADLLLSHIDMIIAIAAAESGGTHMARRVFDLRDVLRQATEDQAKNGLINIDVPKTLPLVDADPDKIVAALNYLLCFVTDDGAIENPVQLSVRTGLAGKSAEFVYISIDQPGKFLTPEDLAAKLRVMDQFGETEGREFDASELSLPIAKSFIELNGGKFNVKSSADRGTLVRFALPIAAVEHQQPLEQLV